MLALKNKTQPVANAVPRQGGAALIVALLLLLVMTILGITALNSATLQNLMSAAQQQQTTALSGIENVLLAGEIDVEDVVRFGINERTHFLDLHEEGVLAFPAGSGSANWNIAELFDDQTIGTTVIRGRYVIEYIGEFELPGESIAAGGGLEDSLIHIFRVSARGGDLSDRAAMRTVQSYYVTIRSPYQD